MEKRMAKINFCSAGGTFSTTFTRQMNAARSLTGKQLFMPKLTAEAPYILCWNTILSVTAALSRSVSLPAS